MAHGKTVKRKKAKRRYKYTPKQIAFFMRITKDPRKLVKWKKRQTVVLRQVKRDLEKYETKAKKIKRQRYIKQNEKKRRQALKWARRQGIDVSEAERKEKRITQQSELAQKAQKQTRKIMKKNTRKKNIIDYLKPNTISQNRQNYTYFMQSDRQIYSTLLDGAMKNPKMFKEELINQIDKLKNMLELEIRVMGLIKKTSYEIATLTTRGKTVKEIQSLLSEFGIQPKAMLDSGKWNRFALAVGAGNSSFENAGNADGIPILDIGFTVRLMRGR